MLSDNKYGKLLVINIIQLKAKVGINLYLDKGDLTLLYFMGLLKQMVVSDLLFKVFKGVLFLDYRLFVRFLSFTQLSVVSLISASVDSSAFE